MLRALGVLVPFLIVATLGPSILATQEFGDGIPSWDARWELPARKIVTPQTEQLQALEAFRATVPTVVASLDPVTGATRKVLNARGSLTPAQPGIDPEALAVAFVREYRDLLGLTADDVHGMALVDRVTSAVTGVTHLYFRQQFRGVALYNGRLQVHVDREGRIVGVENTFLPGLAQAVMEETPERLDGLRLDLAAARRHGSDHLAALGLRVRTPHEADGAAGAGGGELFWLPIQQGEARLVWALEMATEGADLWALTVDALDGQVWTRHPRTHRVAPEYTAYPVAVESPNHTTPLPPADARVLLTDPADLASSPNRWHDDGSTQYTILRGNNAHAYDDSNNSNSPPASEPSCGADLHCNFPLDLSQAPSTYTDASLAQAFYWINSLHDIQAKFGFDEAAGNFQQTNFSGQGAGGDPVQVEVQNSTSCDANFAPTVDGVRPRLQILTCATAGTAFDNGVVAHEFGHGISHRQVGGPSTVSCLGNAQQPGEGWSDWWGLVYTAKATDQGTDARGLGTYFLGQPANGPGIRTQPYSTDPALNTFTYETLRGRSGAHSVGEVWGQALWEVYWALVDAHGFEDLRNPASGAGNHRAMLYINEGLKHTACSPTFTDARDGILQAASTAFNGDDVCLLWQAFAAFGLGSDAVSGGSSSTNVTNGFAVPAGCNILCGNGVIDAGEQCDGGALGGATCGDVACATGTPTCTAQCTLEYGACGDCAVCDFDGVCEAGEDCTGCPSDCVSGSGGGASCGNGVCEAADGEDCLSCAQDCNGKTGGNPSGRFCCGDPGEGCSASGCNSGGFSCTTVPTVPVSYCCGDAVCEGAETGANCSLDCGGGGCFTAGAACSSGGQCCSGTCKGNGTCK
jgi:extracellular elastinolytic metalloproteinase